jgi:flagellar FliL protein
MPTSSHSLRMGFSFDSSACRRLSLVEPSKNNLYYLNQRTNLLEESDVRLAVLLLSIFFIPSLVWANEGKTELPESGIEYLEITPKFTVNLAEPRKYLLVNVQLLLEGPEAVEKTKKNLPAIKHELIILFSGRSAESLHTVGQREALRQETLLAIRKVLDKYENSDGFRDVLFTEFLINY